MKSSLYKIFIQCVTFNLLLGNSIIFVMNKSSFSGDVNYLLMLCMSFASLLCYYILFKSVTFSKHGWILLSILSILNCMVIIALGGWIYSFTGTLIEEELSLSNISMAFFFSVIASLFAFTRFFLIGAAMGLLNLFWLIKAKRLR